MKGDKVLLEAKDFTDGWKEVKALHPTLNIVPRPGGRGNGTERIMQATEEDGKTLFLNITKDHEGDCFLTLGRPSHELLPEEGGEQVEEQDDDEEEDQKDEGPTTKQTAAMHQAYNDATLYGEAGGGGQKQGGRGKRAKRSNPQAEEESSPSKSPKKSSKGKSSTGKWGKSGVVLQMNGCCRMVASNKFI